MPVLSPDRVQPRLFLFQRFINGGQGLLHGKKHGEEGDYHFADNPPEHVAEDAEEDGEEYAPCTPRIVSAERPHHKRNSTERDGHCTNDVEHSDEIGAHPSPGSEENIPS